MPRQGRSAHRLCIACQSASALVSLLNVADGREAFSRGPVHLAATGCFLGSISLLHVVCSVAANRALPDADDDLVLSAADLPAQLPAAHPRSGCRHLCLPAAEPRLATHHLASMHDQFLLPPVCRVVRRQGTCGRVGPDWCITGWRTGPRDGEPDPLYLDCSRSAVPLDRPSAAGARIWLASVLGDRASGRRATLHDGASNDPEQRCLEARPAEGGSSMRRAGRVTGLRRNRTRIA